MGKQLNWTTVARPAVAAACFLSFPLLLRAQAPACSAAAGIMAGLEILDDQGSLVYGNTLHLAGPPGAGTTTQGSFIIVNRDSVSAAQSRPGFNYRNCTYNNLFTTLRSNLINQDDPALAIPSQNVVISNLPRVLPSGQFATVQVSVILPNGTRAGRYVGSFAVRDSLAGVSATTLGEIVGQDQINVEVIVAEQPSLSLADADVAERLDSLVIRGRAGTRASGVVRVVNTGNVSLSNVQVSASDLRSESSVGMVIPAQNVTISTATFSSLAVNDSVRVTVAVDIPRGILGGRYRGTLFVQGEGAAPAQIPLVVIVTSSRGIAFENNPVRNANGVARIAFNGDPGTEYEMSIFDMAGLMTYTARGTVFAGITPAGVPGTVDDPAGGADFAVSVTWPMVNGRGEGVASGLYLVVVESIVNGQRQLARDKLIVIR